MYRQTQRRNMLTLESSGESAIAMSVTKDKIWPISIFNIRLEAYNWGYLHDLNLIYTECNQNFSWSSQHPNIFLPRMYWIFSSPLSHLQSLSTADLPTHPPIYLSICLSTHLSLPNLLVRSCYPVDHITRHFRESSHHSKVLHPLVLLLGTTQHKHLINVCWLTGWIPTLPLTVDGESYKTLFTESIKTCWSLMSAELAPKCPHSVPHDYTYWLSRRHVALLYLTLSPFYTSRRPHWRAVIKPECLEMSKAFAYVEAPRGILHSGGSEAWIPCPSSSLWVAGGAS